MTKFITFLFFALVPLSGHASLYDSLPLEAKEALSDAHATGNNYVIQAVIKYTKDTYPAYAKAIDSQSLKSFTAEKSQKTAVNKAEVAKPKKKKAPKKISGSIDGGINLANGNAKARDTNTTLKLDYETKKWINTFKVISRYNSQNKVRTNEEYFINNQIKYKLSTSDYTFLELEYVNDVFSGFQYRMSELLGYGYKFHDDEILTISGEVSGGARQSLLTTGEEQYSFLSKIGAKAKWQITDSLALENDISSSIGSDVVITVADTSLKTKILESLYLKLNYNIQHVDDAPDGKNHIDTITSVGVGYNF